MYSVNISQFFTAFSAPLMHDFQADLYTMIGFFDFGGVGTTYGNPLNTTIAADQFVSASLFAFFTSNAVEDHDPASKLQEFLSYALLMNSSGSQNSIYVTHPFYYVAQAYAISLSSISAPVFISVVAFFIACCFTMLGYYYRWNIKSIFVPNISLTGTITSARLTALGNLFHGNLFDKLAGMEIVIVDEGKSN